MDTNLQTVIHYHETTKHHQHRYAKSLGYMDWSTQPDPFRSYNGAPKTALPLALEHTTPPYHLLGSDEIPTAPLCKESLSQLMQFSMAIAAHKTNGVQSWAVRCNASSGNLHPTESYLLVPPLLSEHSLLTHYAPKDHSLETLASFETQLWESLPQNSFLLILSSIAWREAWKYGERAFRYVQLDVGHAIKSIEVSAAMLGWCITPLKVDDATIDKLLGVRQKERFFEQEDGDIVLLITPQPPQTLPDITPLLDDLPPHYNSVANKLSPTMHNWEIIPTIIEATKGTLIQLPTTPYQPKKPTQESKKVVLERRSIHIMDPELSHISQESFFSILQSVLWHNCSINLTIMVHRVEGMESGLYMLVRSNEHLTSLQQECSDDFLWKQCALEQLYFLQEGDFRYTSKAISCSQAIASDGAFSLGMVAPLSDELQIHGAHRYKELYWECGMVGQQLYLEATSLNLSGTGIGCFLDDAFHNLLGLKTNRWQSLYHFTVGKGFVDSRIQTRPAY